MSRCDDPTCPLSFPPLLFFHASLVLSSGPIVPAPPSAPISPFAPPRLTGPAVGPDGVERVERVGRAGDVGVAPELDARQLQHLAEDLGARQSAGEGERRQADGVQLSVSGRTARVAQRVPKHLLRLALALTTGEHRV